MMNFIISASDILDQLFWHTDR